MPLFSLTIYWHWSLKNHGHKFTFFDNLLLKKKILFKDHGESKQWHELPAIVKILVFVKHFPDPIISFSIPKSDAIVTGQEPCVTWLLSGDDCI